MRGAKPESIHGEGDGDDVTAKTVSRRRAFSPLFSRVDFALANNRPQRAGRVRTPEWRWPSPNEDGRAAGNQKGRVAKDLHQGRIPRGSICDKSASAGQRSLLFPLLANPNSDARRVCVFAQCRTSDRAAAKSRTLDISRPPRFDGCDAFEFPEKVRRRARQQLRRTASVATAQELEPQFPRADRPVFRLQPQVQGLVSAAPDDRKAVRGNPRTGIGDDTPDDARNRGPAAHSVTIASATSATRIAASAARFWFTRISTRSSSLQSAGLLQKGAAT